MLASPLVSVAEKAEQGRHDCLGGILLNQMSGVRYRAK